MARILIKVALVIGLGFEQAGFAADGQATGLKPMATVISTLHRLDWNRVTPEDLERLTHLSSRRQSFKSTDAIGPCSERMYLTASAARGDRLTAEFSSLRDGDQCRLSLYAITVEWTTPNTEAQLERSAFVTQLKPGGADGCDPEVSEYSWRSLDSQVRFDLGIVVEPQAIEANPTTTANVKIRLTHTNVDPGSVDHLPFEKGTFIKD